MEKPFYVERLPVSLALGVKKVSISGTGGRPGPSENREVSPVKSFALVLYSPKISEFARVQRT